MVLALAGFLCVCVCAHMHTCDAVLSLPAKPAPVVAVCWMGQGLHGAGMGSVEQGWEQKQEWDQEQEQEWEQGRDRW